MFFINVMLLIHKICINVFIQDAFASFVFQVLEIRQRLRQLRLPRFTVENAENVQGKDDAFLKCNAMQSLCANILVFMDMIHIESILPFPIFCRKTIQSHCDFNCAHQGQPIGDGPDLSRVFQ